MEIILAALIAGATAATKDAAGDAVKDSYNALKALLKKKFEKDAVAKAMIDAEPEELKEAEDLLKNKITKAGVDKDEEIKQLAEKLQEALKASESSRSQPKFGGTFTAEKQMIQQAEEIKNENISF